MRLFLICLGGAIGTAARYGTALWTAAAFGSAPAAGTLLVNVVGSFLIALVMQVMPASDLRLMLTTGFLGGFTTYSAFNFEMTAWFRQSAWLAGFTYMLLTLVGCLAAGFAGLALGRVLSPR